VRLRLCALAALIAGVLTVAPDAACAQFGISSFSTSASTQQAGAHVDFTTAFELNTEALGNPDGQLKEVTVNLPPGVIGDPQAIERCSDRNFEAYECPSGTQVGVLDASVIACRGVHTHILAPAEAGESTITVSNTAGFCASEPGNIVTIGAGAAAETAKIAYVASPTMLELEAPLAKHHAAGVSEAVTHVAEATSVPIPLFNLQPSAGHVATLGASLLPAKILIQVDVNRADGYGLTAKISGISTLVLLNGTTLTLWGVPADSSHDSLRCNQLGFACGMAGAAPAAFMTNPTDCEGPPLESSLTVESWQDESAEGKAIMAAPTGCEALAFNPALTVTPETTKLDTPAGYEVGLEVPPDPEAHGLATPELRTVAVTLPAGTSLSPGVATGLQACTTEQFEAGDCPDGSKVGSAEVISPLLPDPLTGSVYVGSPTAAEMYRVFVTVSADNVTVDLFGHIEPNMSTGQVTTVFEDAPQLPFSDFKLRLFGEAGAALANPSTCGPATSTSQIASYAGQLVSPSSTPFVVSADGLGGACPTSQPFGPTFIAGVTAPLAGAFSPFTLTVSRADAQQNLAAIDAELPPGLVGILKSVTLCPEPQAGEGGCPQASEIGTATVGAGAGPLPFYVSGPVYLTGPYAGAPFGLSIAVNAIAGPFDLGRAVVRASVAVDPHDAHLTIDSAQLPQILAGVPLRLRTINIDVNRPGFLLNPTNCSAMALHGTISAIQGATETTFSPFEVDGCRGLRFAPTVTALSHAKTSKADGAYLHVKIGSGPGEANIGKVKVTIPKQLPSRLSTLDMACPDGVFNANPASCPAGSDVGSATAVTPVFANALSGPVYLVSQGGAEFPSFDVVLEGEGVVIDLVGDTRIVKGVTSSTFDSVPDVPVSSFDLVLPEGPHSLLAADTNLCTAALEMPTSLVGHNGATLRRNTKIAVSGCAKTNRNDSKSDARGAPLAARRPPADR
jgi:hypothetical protein